MIESKKLYLSKEEREKVEAEINAAADGLSSQDSSHYENGVNKLDKAWFGWGVRKQKPADKEKS